MHIKRGVFAKKEILRVALDWKQQTISGEISKYMKCKSINNRTTNREQVNDWKCKETKTNNFAI